MPSLVMLMLVIQVAMVIVTFLSVMRAPSAERPKPIWSSLMLSILVVGMVSIEIASDHPDNAWARVLTFGGAVLTGMGLMCAMVALRERRQGGAEPAATSPAV